MKRLILAFCLASAGAAFFSGCAATVQPWQRASLSSYEMRPDRDPLGTVVTDHNYFSREATTGGRGVGGSGCGCN